MSNNGNQQTVHYITSGTPLMPYGSGNVNVNGPHINSNDNGKGKGKHLHGGKKANYRLGKY